MLRHVEVNGQIMDIENPESVTLQDVKAAAVKLDASLANAEAYQDGDTVKFRVRAGTKGAELRKVLWNGQEYDLGGGSSQDPKAIRAELAKLDASVANADYEITGDTIRFFFKAGTKGC